MITILTLLTTILTINLGGSTLDPDYILCKCEIEGTRAVDGETVKSKDVYIYLVQGKEGKDCCSKKADNSYKGFHEIWIAQYTDPRVIWAHDDEKDRKTMSALECQKIGCENENKKVLMIPVESSSHNVKKYYPELVN